MSASATVPVGYKQTEIGVIPEDWIIKSLIETCNYVDYRGRTPPKSDRGRVLVTSRNIRRGRIDYERSKEYISESTYAEYMKRGIPIVGDVLITTEAPLGMVAQIDDDTIALAQRVIKYRPKDIVLYSKFLMYFLLSHSFQNQLKINTIGSTASGIKGSILHRLLINYPSNIDEQKSIAKTLQEAGDLINSLENLITKKRDIKQGAMQELLTGNTRLPGFTREWYKTTLLNLVDPNKAIRYGIVQPGNFDPNGRYMIRGQDYSLAKGWASPSDIFKVTKKVEQKYRNARVNTGDLIMTIVGYCGHVEEIPGWLDGANLTQTTARIAIDSTKADSRYCKYALVSAFCQNQVNMFIKGAAQPGLNCGDVEKFLLQLPPTISEQKAIADVLSDMDAEIAALEERLEKAKAIKQGMMQQLLTGKIRLVN